MNINKNKGGKNGKNISNRGKWIYWEACYSGNAEPES